MQSMPQFLYPTSRQFPFDAACDQIVRALEQRNWAVPGMTVTFYDYGSGAQKLRRVEAIEGNDFKLYFCRVQSTLPDSRWNDTAGITAIHIPKKELHVYEDESGPTLNLYVGDDWERDRESFRNSSKVNSKLNNKARTYLVYKGEGAWRGERPHRLKHSDDLGREYEPTADEPLFFDTAALMAEMAAYLQSVVLAAIEALPAAAKIETLPPPLLPFPSNIGPIFCLAQRRDATRIRQGKQDINALSLADRYGMLGGGYRLIAWGTRNDGTVPDIAYGFLWCGLGMMRDGKALTGKPIDKLVPGHMRGWGEDFVVRVTPTRANDIYIADHAPYDARRAELAAAAPGRDRYTDPEITAFICARARTIVPISEYKGGFAEPIILVNRELDLDEVEIIGDEWPQPR